MRELLSMLQNKPEKSHNDEVRDAYREVFGSERGQEVLAHMLAELGYFNEIVSTPQDTTLMNYARRLLKIMGVLQPSNIPLLVNELMRLPYAEKPKEIKR